MKKLCLTLFFLVFPLIKVIEYKTPKYYVCVVFQDQSTYEEYMSYSSLCVLLRDFDKHSTIESLFITRDL